MYEASERALVLMRVDFGRHLTRKKKEKTSGGRLDPSVRSIRWQQIENKKFTTKGHWKKRRAALRESSFLLNLTIDFSCLLRRCAYFTFTYQHTHKKETIIFSIISFVCFFSSCIADSVQEWWQLDHARSFPCEYLLAIEALSSSPWCVQNSLFFLPRP